MNTQNVLPELLSPAGSPESIYAAVENGADAVYFGIRNEKYRNSFNARSRAENIPLEQLGDILAFLHSKNIKGYITLNTLVFSAELPDVASLIKEIALAGADAVIVQDFGIAKLVKRICPELPLHTSTQMSLTSLRGIETAAETFGIKRAVLPRELSLEQIRQIKQTAAIELECFVHGALCISVSGQCFASFGLGGENVLRSANRGCCAQPCRLPYTLLDGETGGPLTSAKQLLSPCDLSALPVLKELVAAGIDSLKIEGRLKPPEYVAETTRIYRQALGQIKDSGTSVSASAELNEQLSLTFSRGFSTGWLRGTVPVQLVPGNITSHRGAMLGTVIEVRRDAAAVKLVSFVKCGDGVVFDSGTNDEDEPQGGRIYEIFRRGESVKEAEAGAKVLLTFANHSLNSEKIRSGQTIRKTDDPQYRRSVQRSLEKTLAKNTQHQMLIPLVLNVDAVAGKKLTVNVSVADKDVLQLTGETPLEVALKHPLTLEVLREQFNRLGGTAYSLADITANISGKPMLPLSELGKVRRLMLKKLDAMDVAHLLSLRPQKLEVKRSVSENALEELKTEDRRRKTEEERTTVIHLLLRDAVLFENTDLLQEIIAAGCSSFYAELQTIGEYHFAAKAVRKSGGTFTAVLPRIIKPFDEKILAQFAKMQPDAFLVRNLEELVYFRNKAVPLIADFSFNVINELSFAQVLDWGASRITAGWDCSANLNFLKYFSAENVEQIVIGRIPLFMMEHCLWKGNLLKRNADCGRLCRTKPLKIRDRRGAIHSVRSDILCRNTVISSDTFIAENIFSGSGHWRLEWDGSLQFTNTDLPERVHKILNLLKNKISR